MKNNDIKIAASILSADFSKLGSEVGEVLSSGSDWIHIDVMDGHFVPNISFGAVVLKSIRKVTNAFFDTHLMIENCDLFIDEFAKGGSDLITIHYENNSHLHRSLMKIKEHGIKAGLAINPATDVRLIEPVLDYLDMILIMSVNPGFGGQKFIEHSLNKIEQAKYLISNRPIDIQVDGGINDQTIIQAAKRGANIFVAGSYIFNSDDYKKKISLLRENAQQALIL